MNEKHSSAAGRRRETLANYRTIDTGPEQVFDELVALAAAVCQTPMAALSLIDGDRQQFKAVFGLDATETPRSIAFCDHAIRGQETFIVSDARNDPRFADNPLVLNDPHLRFYAGFPLVARDGTPIGALAVLDTRPRRLKPSSLSMRKLKALARLVMLQIETRRAQLALERSLSEQKTLTETLRKRDQQLEQAIELLNFHLENAPLAILELDDALRITRWSPEAERLFGWTRDEVLGQTVEELGLIHSEDREDVAGLFETLLSREVSRVSSVNRNLTRSGKVLVCEWHNSARLDSEGRPVSILAFAKDVTEHRKREEALRLSEERYRYAAEASQAALWDYDMEADRLVFSEAFRDMLGYKRLEDLPGNLADYMELMHPDDRVGVSKKAEQIVAGETDDRGSAEFRLLTCSGEYRWFQSSSKVIRDAGRRAIRRLGSIIDIHDRKVAEEKTRRLAQRLTQTFESLTDGIFAVDRNWRFTYLNPEAERLLQRNRESLIGRNLWEEFPGASEALSGQEYRRAMEEGRSVVFDDYYPPLEAWFHVRAYPSEEGLAVYFHDITKQRESQRQINDAAERMRAILDAATDAIITIDEAGTIESVNPRTTGMFGYDTEELIGQNIKVLMPDSIRGQHDNFLKRYLETGEARIIGSGKKLTARRKDGSEFPIELTVSEVKLSGRRVFTGFVRDISSEEQSRAALHASENRFRSVARTITDVIWDYDLVDGTVWWSDGMEKVFGYPPAEAGTDLDSWGERVHPEDRDAVLASVHRAIAEGTETWSANYRFRRRDGSYAFVVDRAMLLHDDDGKPLRMVGGMTDITERKKAREKLAEQAELLDKARDAIVVRDLDHRITYWNKGAERIYGWTADEALGKPAGELLYKDMATYEQASRRVVAWGRWNGRATHRRKDGAELTVQSHKSLISGTDGKPRAILSINTDISEQLVVEEQLRQSQRLESIGQLTGGVAHDFNNLLTVILGNAELLTDQLEDSPRLQQLAEMIQSSAQRGADLTGRLLAFAGRQALEPQSADIKTLIGGMQPLLQRSLAGNIELRLAHAPGLWRVEVDTIQLESALLNLAINARDAMPEGGRLTIETTNCELDEDYAGARGKVTPGEYVQIAVSDTGTGIAPEIRDRVFEPFFTTKDKGKGTGLGLPMVYGFVKQSHGHVTIYTESGKGTTVQLYLPKSARQAAGEEVSAGHDEIPGGNERILVVEDDEPVKQHARRLLLELGYEVTTASDGSEALEVLKAQPGFDLLFTDVVMPGDLKGPELARAACRLDPGIRVLYTSGYTESAFFHDGRLDDGVKLLQKPYRRAELARRIREALDDHD